MVETTSPCILVTGAAGFIGSHLCERLLDEGYCVWGLDNFDDFYDPAAKRENLSSAVGHADMHLVEGDVRDPVLLDGLMTDVDFDAVVHLAARPGAESSVKNPESTFKVNVGGTLTLLEAVTRHGIPRLVYASSDDVYGDGDVHPYHEDMPADRPLSPYAASKRAGEMLCHAYHHIYDLTVHCLRLSAVYGPRQRPDSSFHRFAESVASGNALTLDFNKSSRRVHTYVQDVVDGIFLSLQRASRQDDDGPEYEIINIGSSHAVPISKMLVALGEAMGRSTEVEIEHPGQDQDTELTAAKTSGQRGRQLLGFEPRVGMEDGIAEFLRWFRQVYPCHFEDDSPSRHASGRGRGRL